MSLTIKCQNEILKYQRKRERERENVRKGLTYPEEARKSDQNWNVTNRMKCQKGASNRKWSSYWDCLKYHSEAKSWEETKVWEKYWSIRKTVSAEKCEKVTEVLEEMSVLKRNSKRQNWELRERLRC